MYIEQCTGTMHRHTVNFASKLSAILFSSNFIKAHRRKSILATWFYRKKCGAWLLEHCLKKKITCWAVSDKLCVDAASVVVVGPHKIIINRFGYQSFRIRIEAEHDPVKKNRFRARPRELTALPSEPRTSLRKFWGFWGVLEAIWRAS